MKMGLIVGSVVALLAILVAACGGPSPTPTPPATVEPTVTATVSPAPTATPVIAAGNFSFLISDEVNAIGDFDSLEVTISSIGLLQGGEYGSWITLQPQVATVDLTLLQGEDAQAIWSGDIPEGEYTKVFIYVSENGISGVIDGESVEDIKLPSNKLQLNSSFEIYNDPNAEPLSYVYDLTVVKAGNEKAGFKYIVKPQIGQSGANQSHNLVEPQQVPVAGLELQLQGDPYLDPEVSVLVTQDGSPVEGATVTVNAVVLSEPTDVNGLVTYTVPEGVEELEIKASFEGEEGELTVNVGEVEAELFEGTITAITEGAENASPWTMNLEGVAGSVTIYVSVLTGTPTVGATASVYGVLEDSTIHEAEGEVQAPEPEATETPIP